MQLQKLTDTQLEQSLGNAVRNERKALYNVIVHIQEVSRRGLHLRQSEPELYKYLVKKFGYSEPAARSRVKAANLVTELPRLEEQVKEGQLNLSQITEIQRAIRQAEKIHNDTVPLDYKAKVVEEVMGKTAEATQQICAELLNIPIKEEEIIRTQADHSKRIETTLTKEQAEKLERVKGLLAQKIFENNRTMEISDVLETCFDYILEQELTTNSSVNPAGTSVEEKWNSLTPKRKKTILHRDSCCQFQDPDTGKICGSQFQLEIDHITPKHKGGRNNPSNLRVLCRSHNQYRYQKNLH